MNKIKLLHIILLMYSCPLFAQEYVVRNFSIDDGLPSSEVHDIYEDYKGFLWFATDRGIARYDGQKFLVINQNNGLPNIVVFNFFEESPHKVWISNVLNELYCFDPLVYPPQFTPYPFNDTLKMQFNKLRSNEHIRRFWVDKEHCLNFSFLVGSGKLKIDKKGESVFVNRNLMYFENSIRSKGVRKDLVIHLDQREPLKEVYTALKDASTDTSKITVYDHEVDKEVYAGPGYSYVTKSLEGIADVTETKDGIKFVLGNQVFTYENGRVKAQKIPFNGLRVRVHNNTTYVASMQGLLRENPSTNQFDQIIDNIHCTDVLWDRNNGLWVSSADKGVFHIANENVRSYQKIDNTPLIFLQLEVNSQYIMGISWTYDHYVFDHQFNLLEINPRVSFSSGIYGSHERPDFNSKYLKKRRFYTDLILDTSKLESQKHIGLKWEEYDNIFCYKSVLIDVNYDTLVWYLFDIPKMYGCARIDSATYLLATEEGLYLRNPGKRPEKYSVDPVFESKMTQIQKFRDGFVVASYMHGLIYFETGNDNPILYDLDKGMSSSSISCFEIIDDSTIWTGSYYGLDKLKFGKSMDQVQISHLNKNNGLSSSEVICMDYHDDTMWVGTKNGLQYFPANMTLQSQLLRPDLFVVDSITLNKSRLSNDTKEIEMTETDMVEFYFTQIAYAVSSDIAYEYQLPEIDSAWISASSGYLRLANLSNGDYTLKIRSVCEEEKSEPYVFQLKVLSPWFKSWWAIIIYVLLGLLIIAIIFKVLLRRVDKKRMAELEKAQLELKALISQMNPHFTFNTINSIQHYIIENDSRMALDYLAEFALLMRQSLDFSRREHITLQEELDFLKLYVDLESRRFGKPIEFKVHTETRYDPEVIGFPALLLQPIIENAVVHGLQGIDYQGRISLSIIEREDYFDIEISDNGIGLTNGKSSHNNNHNRKSHGLDILEQRIKLYNAVNGKASDLQIIQGKEEGVSTTVKIKLYKINHINI